MSNGWGSSAGLNPDAQVFDKLGGMPSLIKPNGVGNDKVASNGDHKNGDSGHDNEKHENGSHEKENVKDTSGWAQAQPYDYSSDNHTWDGNARIYEYDGEDGEFGPEFPELEDQLFGPATSRSGHGIDFSKYVSLAIFLFLSLFIFIFFLLPQEYVDVVGAVVVFIRLTHAITGSLRSPSLKKARSILSLSPLSPMLAFILS